MIRAAARRATRTQGLQRQWCPFRLERVIGASQEMSLFAQRQLIEIRIPSASRARKARSAAALCGTPVGGRAHAGAVPAPRWPADQERWFSALDGAGRRCAWSRGRTACRAGSPSAWRASSNGEEGDEGQRTLAFLPIASRQPARRASGDPELHCCTGGELSFEQVEAAVLNVARYDVFKLGEAVLAGRVSRALRMLDACAPRARRRCWCTGRWPRTSALKRVHDAMGEGKPLPLALREARVWACARSCSSVRCRC